MHVADNISKKYNAKDPSKFTPIGISGIKWARDDVNGADLYFMERVEQCKSGCPNAIFERSIANGKAGISSDGVNDVLDMDGTVQVRNSPTFVWCKVQYEVRDGSRVCTGGSR